MQFLRLSLFIFAFVLSLNSFCQITTSPDTNYYNQGLKSFQKRECSDAISFLNTAISYNPKYDEAYLVRAYAKRYLGDNYGAISDLEKCIEFSSDKEILEDVYSERANIRRTRGNFEGAISDYTKCIEINPSKWNAYTQRGLTKKMLGDWEGAISDYTKCIEINPSDWVTIKFRGLLKIENGQLESGCLDLSRVGEMGISLAYDLIKEHCN